MPVVVIRLVGDVWECRWGVNTPGLSGCAARSLLLRRVAVQIPLHELNALL
jgi:hypothetical protein